MGTNDAAEMLREAQAECVRLEREVARLSVPTPETETEWGEGLVRDDEYEYTVAGDCDGSVIAYLRRTPKRVTRPVVGVWMKTDEAAYTAALSWVARS